MSRVSGYDNHVKAGERNRAWDEVSRLVPADLKRDGWVIALAGSRFLDRKAARQRGFKNIIGVDTDAGVVSHNTEHGRVVINRPLSQVLKSWPDDRSVAVVWADFCSNMASDEVIKAIGAWLCMKSCGRAVLFLNVMKGRETPEVFGAIRDLQEWALDCRSPRDVNRARAAMVVGAGTVIAACGSTAAVEAGLGIESNMVVAAREYLAHKVAMNWAIYRKHFALGDAARTTSEAGDDATKRHISAKLAWSTMRKKAA